MLHLKVPAVLTYSAGTEEIGSPYLVMEKIKGVPLNDMLEKMSLQERWDLTMQVLELQKTLMSVHFRQYGGLYFAKDLMEHSLEDVWLYQNLKGEQIKDDRFVIGRRMPLTP